MRPPYNKDFTSEPIDSEIYFRYIVQCMEEEGEIKGIKKAVQKVIETPMAPTLYYPMDKSCMLLDMKNLYII